MNRVRAEQPVRVLYVCMERILPNSAAGTHVRGLIGGLRRLGFAVVLEAETPALRQGGLWRQLRRYSRIFARSAARLRSSDVVYVRSHFAALPVALSARLLGKPVVHEVNGSYGDVLVTYPRYAGARGMLAWMQRTQYRWARALVAVTGELAAWARAEAGHGCVFVVSNAADTDLFRPEGPSYAHPRPYALFFGGLVRWHGLPTMLEAVRHPAWPRSVDLVVAGPIVDESLRPLIEERPANVIWLGPQCQENLPALIRGALVTLVPITDPSGRSSHGVMPLKLFETLACGTPAIVTDLKGQADFVRENRCGLVVPAEDPQALAQAVAELTGDPGRARRMGEAGARLVAAEHSWDARAAETARIIEDVIRRSR